MISLAIIHGQYYITTWHGKNQVRYHDKKQDKCISIRHNASYLIANPSKWYINSGAALSWKQPLTAKHRTPMLLERGKEKRKKGERGRKGGKPPYTVPCTCDMCTLSTP